MNWKTHVYALGALAAVVLVVYGSVLFPLRSLTANDAPVASIALGRQWAAQGRTVVWNTDGYLGRGGSAATRSFTTPLQRVLPPRYYNTVFFPLAALLVGVGFYLFCCALGLSAWSAFTGAVAVMLSGDFATSVFSGHSGKYLMWAMLVFALWLLTVAIKRRSLLAFLWCGICGGIGVSNQLDVGFIVTLFMVAWAVFLMVRTRSEGRWGRLAAGMAIAVVAAFFYSASMVVSLAGLANQGAGSVAQEQRSPGEQWNWATQWSLPKAETLSLAMPGFFGYGHTQKSPYWGSIGRDADWPRSGFRRFSINTQGIGIATIALALLAVVAGTKRGSPQRPIILFWGVAAVVALLFAYGRYFDIAPTGASGFGPYRVFYWMPKMDAMRNPLKFLFPFMLAMATLAAFGMEALQTALAADKVQKKLGHKDKK